MSNLELEYLRTTAAEYVGVSEGREGHVVAWAASLDGTQTGPRELRYRLIDVQHCDTGKPRVIQDGLGTVQWVHAGGHVPAGWVNNRFVDEHGWLVASTRGTSSEAPRVRIFRFQPLSGGTFGVSEEEFLPDMEFTPIGLRRISVSGMLPSMAPSYPAEADDTSDMRTVCVDSPHALPWLRRLCFPIFDSGVHMLVAFGGGLMWRGFGAGDLEHMCGGGEAHWEATSVEFRLFRPDGRDLAEPGVIRMVDNPDTDRVTYVEVAWVAWLHRWLVVWEELVEEGSGTWRTYRRMATVDQAGTVYPEDFSLRCDDTDSLTYEPPSNPWVAPSPGPKLRCDRDTCKLFNVAYQANAELNPDRFGVIGVYRWVELDHDRDWTKLENRDILTKANSTFMSFDTGLLDGLYVQSAVDMSANSCTQGHGPAPILPLSKVIYHDDGDGDPGNDLPYAYVHAGGETSRRNGVSGVEPYVYFLGHDPGDVFMDGSGVAYNCAKVGPMGGWVPSTMIHMGGMSLSEKSVVAVFSRLDQSGIWYLYASSTALP